MIKKRITLCVMCLVGLCASVWAQGSGGDSGTVPVTYTINFEAGDVSVSGDMQPQTIAEADLSTAVLHSNAFALTGYSFAGWAAMSGGEKLYDDGAAVSAIAFPEGETVITLYAVWTANTYTVHFDRNNGQGTQMADATFGGDTKPTLPPGTYVLPGYTFNGWNTQPNGQGTHYDAGTELDEHLTDQDGATVTLYAEWKPNTYTVRFSANVPEEDQGKVTGEVPSMTCTYGVAYDLPEETFGYEGHSFDYWAEFQVDGQKTDTIGYDAREKFTNLTTEADGEVTLHALWTENTYLVVFNANADDAEGTMESQTFRYGQRGTLNPLAFSRAGYTFEHWSTNPDPARDDTIYVDKAEVQNLLTEAEGMYNLYAHWKPIAYTVHFNGNGGEGAMEPQSFIYDQPQQPSANAFTRHGYTFTGWNTQADGQGTGYAADEEMVKLTADPETPVTLYAQWQGNAYTVRFDKNDKEATGEMDAQSFVYDLSQALSECLFQHPDSTFLGWNTQADGQGRSYGNKQEVKNLTAEADGSVTLYARWGGRMYTVVYHSGEEEYEQSMTLGVEAALRPCGFTRKGYTFKGWTDKPDGTTPVYKDEDKVTDLAEEGDMLHLYAVWAENVYTVYFDGNGSTAGRMENQPFRYSERKALYRNAFLRTGYTFVHWNLSQFGDGQLYEDGEEVVGLSEKNEDIVRLYARWTANRYKIRFHANGTEVTGTMDDMELTWDAAQCALPGNGFTRDGYTFTGWNTAADGSGDGYTDEQPVGNLTATPDTTLTFYAQWEAHSYTVRFLPNGEGVSGTMSDQTFAYDEEKALSGNLYLHNGYTFAGWATTADGAKAYDNGQTVRRLTKNNGEIITLYALWTANRYSVAFDGNGGMGAMETLQLVYDGAAATLPGNGFTREGYTFTGWNTAANGTGTVYTVGQELHNLTAVLDGKIRLYAQWTTNTYTVRYDANGGEGTMAELPMTYDETATLATNAFTRTGHTFTGWNTAADGTGTSHADRAEVHNWTKTDDELITLYAQWHAHTYTVLYVPNGGEGDMDNQPFTYGEQQVLTANAFTRTGYTFAGWNTKMDGTGTAYANAAAVSNLSAKDGDFVGLYAQWKPIQYNITFRNDDGTVLQSGLCDYDSMPKYTGATPTKASTAEYDYEFTGWTPYIVPVTGDAAYTATYRAVKRTYTVTFVSEGVTLQTDELEYGRMPYYRGDDPVKAPTDEVEYRFTGWTPDITAVTGDAVYTAVFEESERTYLHGTAAGGMTIRTESLHIYISGIGDEEEVQVFDLNARRIYRGTSRDIEVPAAGLYMLCRAGETVKVMIK